MKEHLQTAIELLSRRLKTGRPLDPFNFSRLEEAIAAIIDDAGPEASAAAAAAAAVAAPAAVPTPPPFAPAAAAAEVMRASIPDEVPYGDLDDAEDEEMNESEGPKWNSAAGYGMPVGIKNVSDTVEYSSMCLSTTPSAWTQTPDIMFLCKVRRV